MCHVFYAEEAKRTGLDLCPSGFPVFVKGQITARFGKLSNWTQSGLLEPENRGTYSPVVIQERLHTEEVTFGQLELDITII